MVEGKIVLLYDCPIWDCDKIWLYDELKKSCKDMVVLDTKVRLSELYVAGTAGRVRVYLMMFKQILQCLKYKNEKNVTYIVWKRNSAILLNMVFTLLKIRAGIVSFNWLTPDEHSRHKHLIKKCLLNSSFLMIVNLKENIGLYKKIYKLSHTEHILYLPDVYDTKTGFAVCNEEALQSDYFFTGGMSNRDFRIILETALRFPDYRFVIVALKEQWEFAAWDIPANVITYFNTKQDTYYNLMKGARAVILPLLDQRVAGLINICKAFQYGILCLSTRTSATSLYYKSGDSDLFEIGDKEQLARIISRVAGYDKETYLSEVSTRQEYIKKTFSPDKVIEKLLFYLNR